MSNNRNNRNRNNNATPASAPAQETPAVVTAMEGNEGATLAKQEESPLFGGVRPFADIAADIQFSAHDGVTIAGTVTAHELGHFMAVTMDGQASINTRLANCLRHARKLPAVKVDKRDKWGQPLGSETVSAFEFLKERLKAGAATEGQFQNMFQLVPAADFIADNELEGKANVFLVKNVMGTLRQMGVLPPADKKAEYTPGSLKVKLPDAPDQTALAIMDSLQAGASQAKMKEAIAKAEAEKAEAKKAADAAKAAEVKALIDANSTKGAAPVVEGAPVTHAPASDAPASVTPPVVNEEKKEAKKYPPDYVARGITSVLGMWDNSIGEGFTREQLREHCQAEYAKLVTLMTAE